MPYTLLPFLSLILILRCCCVIISMVLLLLLILLVLISYIFIRTLLWYDTATRTAAVLGVQAVAHIYVRTLLLLCCTRRVDAAGNTTIDPDTYAAATAVHDIYSAAFTINTTSCCCADTIAVAAAIASPLVTEVRPQVHFQEGTGTGLVATDAGCTGQPPQKEQDAEQLESADTGKGGQHGADIGRPHSSFGKDHQKRLRY